MKIYDSLYKIKPVRKRYAAKFLLIAFAGIHVPLIGMCIYLMVGHTPPVGVMVILLLVLTLAATATTLYIQNKLLEPVKLANTSLDNYLSDKTIPGLPIHYEDEVGMLLHNIQATIEKLDGSLQEKNGVIDMLSHDLRSPVARIAGLAHVMKIDDKDNLQEHADDIIKECDSLLKLLQHMLLTLKHEEIAESKLATVPTSLKDIVLSSIVSFDFTLTKKGIKWDIDIDDSLMINVEPVLFTQVIKNLVSNAIKFSPAGKAIHIFSKVNGRWLMIAVKDNGNGFDPKDAGKMFQRFTSAGKAGTGGEYSTGLGLYLCKKIVERHGGDIIAESDEPGKGATFTIVLPYASFHAN